MIGLIVMQDIHVCVQRPKSTINFGYFEARSEYSIIGIYLGYATTNTTRYGISSSTLVIILRVLLIVGMGYNLPWLGREFWQVMN